MLVVGGNEMLLGDNLNFVSRAHRAGAPVQLCVLPCPNTRRACMHVFAMACCCHPQQQQQQQQHRTALYAAQPLRVRAGIVRSIIIRTD
jgi:hypothetical protein